ncbi:MAG: beta-lactamase [Edaphobacter sp.]|nr:beta-lactamase [Edaphobacter sp.]
MPRHLAFLCPVVFTLFSTIAASSKAQQPAPKDPLPKGIHWTQLPPPKFGIDAAALDTLYSDMKEEQHHDLKGIVIVRNGSLISEHYFNGDSSRTLHDIRSATKSLTSLLMGIAIDKENRS